MNLTAQQKLQLGWAMRGSTANQTPSQRLLNNGLFEEQFPMLTNISYLDQSSTITEAEPPSLHLITPVSRHNIGRVHVVATDNRFTNKRGVSVQPQRRNRHQTRTFDAQDNSIDIEGVLLPKKKWKKRSKSNKRRGGKVLKQVDLTNIDIEHLK